MNREIFIIIFRVANTHNATKALPIVEAERHCAMVWDAGSTDGVRRQSGVVFIYMAHRQRTELAKQQTNTESAVFQERLRTARERCQKYDRESEENHGGATITATPYLESGKSQAIFLFIASTCDRGNCLFITKRLRMAFSKNAHLMKWLEYFCFDFIEENQGQKASHRKNSAAASFDAELCCSSVGGQGR